MLLQTLARWIVFVASCGLLCVGLGVLFTERRRDRPAPLERSGGLLAAVNFVGILGFSGVGAASAVWGFGMVPVRDAVLAGAIRIVGLACLSAAGALAVWGLASMGRQMSSQAEVRPDTQLVTGGAFGLVRHPLYLSILLLWAGGSLSLLSWVMALCTVALVRPFVARSSLEEEMLVRHFGPEYGAYASRVPMLWPWRYVMSNGDRARNVATAVWGALLVWAGTALLLGFSWGLGLLGAGVILLAAQAARRYLQLKVDGFGLVAGLVLASCGVASIASIAVDLFPFVLIVAGVALIVSIWTKRGEAEGAPRGQGEPGTHPHPRV